MDRHLPTRPGWYRNPDEPRSLRYWDGKSWTGRARSRPAWASEAEPFELTEQDFDRSVEGPVHPKQLREPVTTGAWAREWFLSWRPRQADQTWHEGSEQTSRPQLSPRAVPSIKLGQARRPLLVLAVLFVVAFAVVVSSFAVMAPYETRGGVQPVDQGAQESFVAKASRECAAVLPKYRPVFADSVDGPSILVAARQVGLLGDRLAAVPAVAGMRGPVQEWLLAWKNFAAEERRYAAIIGPAERLDGRLAPRRLPAKAQLAADAARRQADQLALDADRFSSNLVGTTCRLQEAPAA